MSAAEAFVEYENSNDEICTDIKAHRAAVGTHGSAGGFGG